METMLDLLEIIKPDGSKRQVAIIYDRKYGWRFVNLSPNKEHICPCCFDTKNDAYADLDKNVKEGKVVSYKRVDEFVLVASN